MDKVTAFVVRESPRGHELLLFEHPHAGIQVPAGTVEEDEPFEAAVLREAHEETGLTALSIERYLGTTDDLLADRQRIITARTKVYARPDVTSFDWSILPRAAWVTASRKANGFTQVTYEEYDQFPNPEYVTMCITGWVPDSVLTDQQRRHYYVLSISGETPVRWTVAIDNHVFTLFWAPLMALPRLIAPQDKWLSLLSRAFPFLPP